MSKYIEILRDIGLSIIVVIIIVFLMKTFMVYTLNFDVPKWIEVVYENKL